MSRKKKESLEEVLITSWHGTPVLKADERRLFLGTFYERVITFATEEDFKKNLVDEKVMKSFKDERAKELLINSRYVSKLSKYLNLANKHGLKYKVVSRKKECTDIILVVASQKAIRK